MRMYANECRSRNLPGVLQAEARMTIVGYAVPAPKSTDVRGFLFSKKLAVQQALSELGEAITDMSPMEVMDTVAAAERQWDNDMMDWEYQMGADL